MSILLLPKVDNIPVRFENYKPLFSLSLCDAAFLQNLPLRKPKWISSLLLTTRVKYASIFPRTDGFRDLPSSHRNHT